MTETNVECPLCDGRGHILRSEIVERLTTPEQRARFEARIEKLLAESGLAEVQPVAHSFEKEVHQWNPQLPIWRRSPKE